LLLASSAVTVNVKATPAETGDGAATAKCVAGAAATTVIEPLEPWMPGVATSLRDRNWLPGVRKVALNRPYAPT
jgi:hypothetical protein